MQKASMVSGTGRTFSSAEKGPFTDHECYNVSGLGGTDIVVKNYSQQTLWTVGEDGLAVSHGSIVQPSTGDNQFSGVWVLYRTYSCCLEAERKYAFHISQLTTQDIRDGVRPIGLHYPIFETEESATAYVVAAHVFAKSSVEHPRIYISTPLNPSIVGFVTHLFGETYNVPFIESADNTTYKVNVIGKKGQVILSIDMRDFEKNRYSAIELPDNNWLYIGSSEATLEFAKSGTQRVIFERFTKFRDVAIVELEDKLAAEKARHAETAKERDLYKGKHSEEVLNNQTELKKEVTELRAFEQKEKTKRTVSDNSAASTKSAASILTSVITIGASVLTIGAIAFPFFKAAAIAKGIGSFFMSGLACIFGFW